MTTNSPERDILPAIPDEYPHLFPPISSIRKARAIVRSKYSLPLPGFKSLVEKRIKKRSDRLFAYLMDRASRLNQPCEVCANTQSRSTFTIKVYEDPWKPDLEFEYHYFCSGACMVEFRDSENWSYFTCDECGRIIHRQHPKNPCHIQSRHYHTQELCLRCYEKVILKNGIDSFTLMSKNALDAGMFLSKTYSEMYSLGYRDIITNFFIYKSKDNAKSFITEACRTIHRGQQIVIGYEKMSRDGDEGSMTLWAKYRPGFEPKAD